jgi:hypothetical protein
MLCNRSSSERLMVDGKLGGGLMDALLRLTRLSREVAGLALIFLVLVMAACAQVADRVLFVTKTSMGIEVDSTPPTANIAYDRVEGFIGPMFENGGLPPIVAYLETDSTLYEPKINQIYATGHAAEAAVGLPLRGPTTLDGNPKSARAAFFGTKTTIGLNIGFSETNLAPNSFIFGFKRKELSLIPVANSGTTGVDGKSSTTGIYPSVLASLTTRAAATSTSSTTFMVGQYFATGTAAVQVASTSAVREILQPNSGKVVSRDVSNPMNAFTRATSGLTPTR